MVAKSKFLKLQSELLTAGKIDRRRFISSAMATGVALPAALSMANSAMAMTPKMGGHFRVGSRHGSTTDTLDPARFENGFMTGTGFMYGNNLTVIDNTGQLVNEIATSVDSDDAQTWVLGLPTDLEFHNGKTLTADDVVATFNYHRDENSKSAAKGLLTAITDVRADCDKVVFELDAPNADFPYIVSDYHLIILPSQDGMVDPTAGIGTGSYVIEEFEPGVRVMASRNPNYFKSDAAYFDSVELLALIDTTARQNALMNGDVDAIGGVDPKTVALMSRNPDVEILEVSGTLHYTFPMRVDTPPFDNYDFRMALKLALKRQEMVDKILLGHGTLGNDHPISSATSFYAADIPQREFDPELAAEHYKKSGHSGPIQLSTSDAAFAGAVDAAQLYAASAKEVGIEIEVVREPSDGYWANVWNKKPWCACYWSGRPTSDWMYSSAYVETTEWNDTAWRDTPAADRFNELVKLARAELDQAKRAAMYRETQMLIRDDGGAVVPMFANHIMGVNKNRIAHDPVIAGNWELDGNRAFERWWMA